MSHLPSFPSPLSPLIDPWCSCRGQTALRSEGQQTCPTMSFHFTLYQLFAVHINHQSSFFVPVTFPVFSYFFPPQFSDLGTRGVEGWALRRGNRRHWAKTSPRDQPRSTPDSPSSPSRPPSCTLAFLPPRIHTMNSLLPYRTSCCGPELKSDSLRWLPEGSRGELRLSLSLWRVLPALWLPSSSANGAPKPQEVSRGPEEEDRNR